VERALDLLRQAEGPVLLVLDDLHYADEGTVAVLVRLAMESAQRRWLILAAFRPEEGTAALREGATEIVAQGVARRLNLPPLSRDAVARLVTAVRRRPAEGPEVEAIYTDSGGNPWFAEALARGNGAVTTARDRISLRLERFERENPGAHAVLAALAPAARPLPHDIVATLRDGDSPALRRTLAGLRDAGLLRESEDGWTFRHELLRRSILDGMIAADRRDAHQRLAEALHARESGEVRPPTPDSRLPTPSRRHASAAEIAMHFAEAGDARAVDWALRAAAEARAIDAHTEALGQLERALSFEMEPERRRAALRDAAREAYDLARFDDIERFVNEAAAIPGGEPEVLANLHQLAARAAFHRGDPEADDTHLAAAERVLAARPVGRAAVSIAAARVARAALYVQPERLAEAAERALRLARALNDEPAAEEAQAQVKSFTVVSLLDCGDPAGFAVLDEVLRLTNERGMQPGLMVSALSNAYQEAVLSLFHMAAVELYEQAVTAMQRHQLDWLSLEQPYRVLELTQRGRYAEARSLTGELLMPAAVNPEAAALRCATVLREVRAGSLERAAALLADWGPAPGFQQTALVELARLELASAESSDALGELAQRVYGTMARHRYARVAGVAAVALARAGRGAAPVPSWLVAASPLHVFWDWAAGIACRDTPLLRDVADRLAAMECPYEAALARRDAGDLTEAYQAFRALDAVQAREQTAAQLRAAGRPVPRRTRAADAAGRLTDTEREVTRLVAEGRGNKEIAAALGISVRTVTTHLTRIFAKTGCQGRTQLVLWWTHQAAR
jgi:DNA-binding CsgD family transcriptional regulator